jgi:hypothetical protein
VWFTPVIPAVGRLRQEELEFQASLGYRSCLKKTKQTRKKKKNTYLSVSIAISWCCHMSFNTVAATHMWLWSL